MHSLPFYTNFFYQTLGFSCQFTFNNSIVKYLHYLHAKHLLHLCCIFNYFLCIHKHRTPRNLSLNIIWNRLQRNCFTFYICWSLYNSFHLNWPSLQFFNEIFFVRFRSSYSFLFSRPINTFVASSSLLCETSMKNINVLTD